MPSPLAHSLAGIATARLLAPAQPKRPWLWYGVAVVAANAADFDIFGGLLAGSINEFHGLATHSVFAMLVACAVAAIPRSPSLGGRAKVGALVGVAYATHIFLDLFTGPAPRPGLPLLWPFSDEQWMSPWLPFAGIRHGDVDSGAAVFVDALFSADNARAAGFELLVLGPVVALVWWLTRRRGAPR